MKKIFLLICILSGIISGKAQIGADCNHPIGISPNGCINNNIQNGTYMWFRFTADATNKKIELKKHPLSGGHIHAMGLLADDCNTITILDSAKIVPGNDSLLVINATNLVVGTSYFIVTERDKPTCTKCVTGAAEFDLCMERFGKDCVSAINLNYGLTFDSINSRGEQWYVFTANTPQITINVKNTIFRFGNFINSLYLYSGNCNTLNSIALSTSYSIDDSLVSLNYSGLTIGDYYYVKIFRNEKDTTGLFTIDTRDFPSVNCNATGCNLIANGDFEFNTNIPLGTNQLNLACPWSSASNMGASPDYLYAGAPPTSVGVPVNNWGTQNDFAGLNGYVGIAAFYDIPGAPINFHEYIYQPLSTPLIVGESYTASFYVSLSDRSAFEVNSLGMLFTTANPFFTGTGGAPGQMPIPAGSFLVSSFPNFIADKQNWIQITQTFVATTPYQFITIGDFGSSNTANVRPATDPSGTTTYNASYYYIDWVEVVHNVSINANSAAICSGQSATLTATSTTPGVTYMWTPGGATNNPLVVTPTTTTTYNVTGTINNCTTNAISVVTVNPNPTITVNSPTICAGTFASLTATGATTYTWMPGGLTGSTINVSPTSTTTYTVTGTTAGCSGTAITTVTVNPAPTVTATASPSSFIIGGSTTLTASGTAGVNYTWSPGGSTGSTLTVTPTATGTYTYTVIAVNPITGCASSTTVTFTVQPPQCNLTYDYIIPSGSTSISVFGGTPSSSVSVVTKNIYINGTFTLNNKLTLVGCNVVMAPNARIIVPGDMELRLTQKTHVFSCVDMWDGIYVLFHGKLMSEGSTIIEDAINAVNISNGAYLCLFDETIFNKNLRAIKINTSTSTTSPITVVRSIFTSRTIPFFTSVALNPNVNAVRTNVLSNIYGFANINGYSTAGIPIQRGGIGIDGSAVTNLKVGYDGLILAGTSATNVFDAIKCGVYLSNTNATVFNNIFQYHSNPSSLCSGCINLAGYGVYASSSSATASYSLQVGGNVNIYQPNDFKNNYIGVYSFNYRTNGVIKNTISNISTGTPPPFGYGQAGMFIQPAQNNVLVLNENTITNCKEAIFVNLGTTTATSSIVAMQVNNNTITANATGFCTNGIYVTSLVAGSATVNAQVKDNVITEAVNGIQLLNLKRTVNVQTNSCEVRYASTGNRNGIVAKGCQQLKIENNHTKYNNVGGLAYNLGGNLAAYGIYLQQSTNMLVKCNKIDDAARSMVFEGTCTSSPWLAGYGIFQNTMSRGQDGFVLLNNGVIGQQGAFTPPFFNYASNNYWDNTTTPTFISQTFMDNTFNANSTSRLFMNNTALTLPTSNFSSPAGFQYISTGTSPGLNIATAVPPACGPVPAIAPPGGGGSVALNYGNELKTLLEDSVNLQFYIQETNWMRKQFVYYELMNNAPMAAFNGLNSFKTQMLTGNVGKLKRVEERIENGNYIAANAINNTVNPENILEQNQKSMNTYIIKQLINAAYTYSAAETADVLTIANQCPLEGGQAVYQARNLAMDIKQQVIDFVDNCDKLPRREMQAIPATPEKENSLFKLYPNPNDGSMNLIYTMEASSQGQFILYDITGKTISTYVLQQGINNQLFINETILNNGVYFYKVIIDGIVKTSDKLVIIR